MNNTIVYLFVTTNNLGMDKWLALPLVMESISLLLKGDLTLS